MNRADRDLVDRLRALNAQLDLRSPPRDGPREESAWVMSHVDVMLDRARALTSLLRETDDPARWDEADHVVGRLALRDIAAAVALIRRRQINLVAELEKTGDEVRSLPRQLDGLEAKILAYLLKRAELDARRRRKP